MRHSPAFLFDGLAFVVAELGRAIGAGDNAGTDGLAFVPVYYYDAVFSPFENRTHRACSEAGGICAMIAGYNKIENPYLRETPGFNRFKSPPVGGPRFYVVPVFAGHDTGAATHASCLIKIKCHLFFHGKNPFNLS
jgi:hypothetical protein